MALTDLRLPGACTRSPYKLQRTEYAFHEGLHPTSRAGTTFYEVPDDCSSHEQQQDVDEEPHDVQHEHGEHPDDEQDDCNGEKHDAVQRKNPSASRGMIV